MVIELHSIAFEVREIQYLSKRYWIIRTFMYRLFCKILQKKHSKRKPLDGTESLVNNENHSTTERAVSYKWEDKLKTIKIKL